MLYIMCVVKMEAFMAISAHLKTLKNKHTALEGEIEQELQYPVPDYIRLAELKKQKLHIKDRLAGFNLH